MCLFYTSTSICQTIPYATQQPQWVFPIYGKDATGKRDTAYLCHDLNSDYWVTYEENFGEIWFPSPTDFFLSTLNSYLFDSALRVDCHDLSKGDYNYSLDIANAVFPVTLYWDKSLLNSPMLPFPVNSTYPDAFFEIEYGNGNFEVTNAVPPANCNISWPAIVADTVSPICQCQVRDSMVINDWTGNPSPQTSYFPITIMPWNDCGMGISDEKNEMVELFPNPCKDYINITTKQNISFTRYEIVDSFGRIVVKDNFSKTIDVSSLSKGIYQLRIYDKINSSPLITKLLRQ